MGTGEGIALFDLLQEARRHYPDTAQITYLLAIALREAKQTQTAVTTFAEALHESEASGQEIVNGRFFFEYGAAAEQAKRRQRRAVRRRDGGEADMRAGGSAGGTSA